MEHHFVRNITQRSKRHLNMNELFVSPSFHHGKQARLFKQEALNQNRSLSPIHMHQQFQKKNIYSSSYTSLNSYLKEFHLSEKDFFELRQALKTIFDYLQSKIISDDKQLLKQRLTSPYLQQQQLNNALPLYTNEYFIRNGLLNHNDGPEMNDNTFQSKNLCYSHHCKSCSSSLSSLVNISLPLTLLSNQKYLLTALTSNFTTEKSRRSQSSMELNLFKYYGKDNNESETESMMIRRNKVQIWESENILQQKMSRAYSSIQQNDQIETSEYYRSSIVRTPSTNKDETTINMIEESIAENSSSSSRIYNKKEGNDKLLKTKNIDDLFPMVKILAPYIIIRDSFQLNSNQNHSNCILPMNIDNQNNKKVKHLITASEKRSLNDVLHPALITAKHRSVLLSSSSTMNQTRQTNCEEQVYQRKKNYLLAEFESVLTQISKK